MSLRLFRSTKPIPRNPKVYEPCIIIVGQGRKREYLGNAIYTYDPGSYLVLSVPLPLECETLEASLEKPALAVSIPVTSAVLGELLMEMNTVDRYFKSVPRGLYTTAVRDNVLDATIRLLECLQSPMDSRILGAQMVREIIYRVLCDTQGGALRSLASRHSYFSQIARVLKRMHIEYARPLDVKTLAGDANMGISTFHHNFKAVTAVSPLQYLKKIRLHKARMSMVQDGVNAGSAAAMVGHDSASQFNREFKRLFGSTPLNETARLRETGADK